MKKKEATEEPGFEYDDLKVVNCANCGQECLGESMYELWHNAPKSVRAQMPPMLGGRIMQRPYCKPCCRIKIPQLDTRWRKSIDDNSGPWGENAVRELEG